MGETSDALEDDFCIEGLGSRRWSSQIGDLRIGRAVGPDLLLVLNVEIIGRGSVCTQILVSLFFCGDWMPVGDIFLAPLSLTFSCSGIGITFVFPPPGTLENDEVECDDEAVLGSLVVDPDIEDGAA